MYFIRRTTQPGHYRFFLIPPKNPYSNQATQKNTCQIFVPKKIPESKISNPKKSFDHPRHLKSRVPPRATSLIALRNFCFSASYPQKIWLLVVQSSESFAFLLLPLRKYGLHSYNLLQKFHVFVYFFGKFCQRGVYIK